LDQIWKKWFPYSSHQKKAFFSSAQGELANLHLSRILFPDSFLLPDVFRTYLAHPERLRETVMANRDKKVVVIDEVQKVPEILEVVHSLMEEKKGRQFILT
jgi:hypothetical protein